MKAPLSTDLKTANIIAVRRFTIIKNIEIKGSYVSAHVLFNFLNELGKRDKVQGLSITQEHEFKILFITCHLNYLKITFWREHINICHCLRNVLMDVIT